MTSLHGDRSSGPVAVVVAAAGRGERLGGARPKALESVAGQSLLAHCLAALSKVAGVAAVVVAAPADELAAVKDICAQYDLPLTVVPGGATRPGSVAAALAVLPAEIEIVLVHDAARAFAPAALFTEVIAAVAAGADAVIPGLPVVDTIKDVDTSGIVTRTVPRASLRAVQTPQGFTRDLLASVHSDPRLADATDDAGMVEAAGYPVRVVPGHADAFKVTTPFDRLIAETLIRERVHADG